MTTRRIALVILCVLLGSSGSRGEDDMSRARKLLSARMTAMSYDAVEYSRDNPDYLTVPSETLRGLSTKFPHQMPTGDPMLKMLRSR